ncbi:hypothetical protein [Paraburkholderia bannensis]|uniref:hypothetical protein n=1 Tax=Paraburkholderia bannensis TaxID=765414 RepID=UPI002AB14FCE|nr:hypothetical protein [Paraburkholderia bannensis]
MKKLLLRLIAAAISIVRALATVASVTFNALMLALFIALHLPEMRRMLSAQSIGVQLVIRFWLGIFVLEVFWRVAGK